MWPVGRARLVAVSLVLVLFAGVPATAVAPAGAAVGDQITAFQYQPPTDFVGDLALRFVFDWGAENPCRVLFGMSGVPSEAPLWGIVSSDEGDTYAMYHDYALRAHGDGLVVHPGVVLGEDNWGFGIFEGVPRSGEEAFTLAGAGLARWVAPEGGVFENLFFQVDCDQPFTVVAIAGGDRVLGFSELGGSGVGGGAYSPALEAQLAISDGVAATMAEPLVALVVRASAGEGAAFGAFDVTTPDGTLSETAAAGFSFDHTGGPGGYAVSVSQVAAAATTTMFASLVGLHPVASLNDLDRWTG